MGEKALRLQAEALRLKASAICMELAASLHRRKSRYMLPSKLSEVTPMPSSKRLPGVPEAKTGFPGYLVQVTPSGEEAMPMP